MSDKVIKTEEATKENNSYVSVRIIKVFGINKTSLIEWTVDNKVCRGYVPISKIKDDSVDEKTLMAATPYGVPWENIKVQEVTPVIIAYNLHNAGIWTAEDLRKNQQEALGAIQAAYQLTLGSLNQAAKQFQMEGEK